MTDTAVYARSET